MASAELRYDWTRAEVQALFDLPFNDLLFQAQTVHRQNFEPNRVQLSTLLSIKTGACPEDCAYCPQSARYETGLQKEPLMDVEAVVSAAREARANGATRFCMGAAWRAPKDRDLDKVEAMVREVKASPMLFGYRGSEVVDVGEVERLISRVSQLQNDMPQLSALELGLVLAGPSGSTVLDASARVEPAADSRSDWFVRRMPSQPGDTIPS